MLVSGRVNFTFARGEVLDHSTAGPTGVPMHRSTRCMRFRSRRPVNPKPPWGKTHEIRVAKDVCNFLLMMWKYTRNLWVCPLFWGFNFSPPKEGRTKLHQKRGQLGSYRYVTISSKTSRFELPQEVVISFRCLRTKLQPSDQNWSLYVDQDSGDNNTHVWYIYHIFTYIYHKNHPTVGKYTIRGSSGITFWTLAASLIDWPHVYI